MDRPDKASAGCTRFIPATRVGIRNCFDDLKVSMSIPSKCARINQINNAQYNGNNDQPFFQAVAFMKNDNSR